MDSDIQSKSETTQSISH